MINVPTRRYVKTHGEDGSVKMEADIGVMLLQARKTKRHQKVEKARK